MEMFGDKKNRQSQIAGDNAILIQAGRDVNLVVTKSPPKIRLVRISTEDDHSRGCLKQKINVVLKNNGDTSAVLLEGFLVVEGKAKITNCNYMFARYSLIRSDWKYDVDIDGPDARFTGTHALAPTEVVSFELHPVPKTPS